MWPFNEYPYNTITYSSLIPRLFAEVWNWNYYSFYSTCHAQRSHWDSPAAKQISISVCLASVLPTEWTWHGIQDNTDIHTTITCLGMLLDITSFLGTLRYWSSYIYPVTDTASSTGTHYGLSSQFDVDSGQLLCKSFSADYTLILEINAVILLMWTLRVIFRAHLNKNIY